MDKRTVLLLYMTNRNLEMVSLWDETGKGCPDYEPDFVDWADGWGTRFYEKVVYINDEDLGGKENEWGIEELGRYFKLVLRTLEDLTDGEIDTLSEMNPLNEYYAEFKKECARMGV